MCNFYWYCHVRSHSNYHTYIAIQEAVTFIIQTELQRNYWTATARADHVAEPNCKPEEVTPFQLNLTLLPLAQILPVLFFMIMTESKHWVVANIHTTQTNNVMTIVNYAVVVFSWLSVSLSVSLSLLLLDGLLFFCEDSLLPLGLFTPFFPSTSGSFSITWSKARGIQARWRGKKYHNKHMLYHHCGAKQHTAIFRHTNNAGCFSSRLSAVVDKPMLHHVNATAEDSLPYYAVRPPWVSGTYYQTSILWNHKVRRSLSKLAILHNC